MLKVGKNGRKTRSVCGQLHSKHFIFDLNCKAAMHDYHMVRTDIICCEHRSAARLGQLSHTHWAATPNCMAAWGYGAGQYKSVARKFLARWFWV